MTELEQEYFEGQIAELNTAVIRLTNRMDEYYQLLIAYRKTVKRLHKALTAKRKEESECA